MKRLENRVFPLNRELEVAATAEVEETESWDKHYSFSYRENLKNHSVYDGRLKFLRFPPKRPRHLLQPQLALPLLLHQTLAVSVLFGYREWEYAVLCTLYRIFWDRVGCLGCFKDKDVFSGPFISCSTIITLYYINSVFLFFSHIS